MSYGPFHDAARCELPVLAWGWGWGGHPPTGKRKPDSLSSDRCHPPRGDPVQAGLQESVFMHTCPQGDSVIFSEQLNHGLEPVPTEIR